MLRTLSLVSLLLFAAACAVSDTGSSQGQSGSGTADGEGEDGDGGNDGGDSGDSGDDAEDGDGHGDRDDCKIEDGDIGRDVVVELGSVSVTFGDWVAKDDSPGEYIGFTMTLEGADAITYRVKAGGEVFADTALTWIHPAGTSGPEASGISYVDMCDDDGDHGDDGGDDDGGDHDDDGGDGGDHDDDGGDGGDHGDDGGDDDDGGDVDVG